MMKIDLRLLVKRQQDDSVNLNKNISLVRCPDQSAVLNHTGIVFLKQIFFNSMTSCITLSEMSKFDSNITLYLKLVLKSVEQF